jgi:hypothetical protein
MIAVEWIVWRCRPGSNWLLTVLQTTAFVRIGCGLESRPTFEGVADAHYIRIGRLVTPHPGDHLPQFDLLRWRKNGEPLFAQHKRLAFLLQRKALMMWPDWLWSRITAVLADVPGHRRRALYPDCEVGHAAA